MAKKGGNKANKGSTNKKKVAEPEPQAPPAEEPRKRDNKKANKGNKARKPQRPAKKKNRQGPALYHGQEQTALGWLADNWKVIALFSLFFGFLTVTKMREEMFGMHGLGRGEQVAVDLYSLLGIARTADSQEIGDAYKKKAAELHPDKNPGCLDCQERFANVSTAYNTLRDPELRQHYDNTNTILKKVKSKTEELTSENYGRLVEETTDLWMIMVYMDADEMSNTFTNFWDEVAAKYPFVKFGRINYVREAALVRRLPFRIEEIPFILYIDKYGSSDFLEFSYRNESKSPLIRFVRKSIGTNFAKPGLAALEKTISGPAEPKPSVIYVSKSYMPTAYCYMGYKFGSQINVLSTNFGEHKKIYKLAGGEYDYVFKLPGHLKLEGSSQVGIQFESKFQRQEEAHMNVFTLSKFLLIPEIRRNSFNDFCKEYQVSESAESNKYSVCILALKNSPGGAFDELMEVFREEQNKHLPTFVDKIRAMETDVFDTFRSIQFGYIDVARNKAFAKLVQDKVSMKNPKALIYISGQNKIQFYNSVDDVLDAVDDLTNGEADGFTHFRKFSEDVKPFNTYLVPDYITFTTLFIRSAKAQFLSVWNVIIALGLVILAPNISKFDYTTMGALIAVAYTAIAVLSAVMGGIRSGIF